MSTKVISARVPVDVYAMLNALSKEKGQSKNKIVADMIQHTTNSPTRITVPSTVNIKPMPKVLKNALIGVGGAAVGYIVYQLLQEHLPKYNYTEEDVDTISALAAIASGLGTGVLLSNLLREE
jgi:hypothetical protein